MLCLAYNCLCSQHLQSLHTQSAQYCTDCNCCCNGLQGRHTLGCAVMGIRFVAQC